MPTHIVPNMFHQIAPYAQAVARHPQARRALCFGDSWFQYPPHAIDVSKLLARTFRQSLFLNEAVPGRDSAQWKLALPRVQREIGSFQFDAILLSTGGNDIVGSEMAEFVKTPTRPQSIGTRDWGVVPPVVFDFVRLETFQHALEYAIKDFSEVVGYRDASAPQSIVFVHTYDYIFPDGRPYRLGPLTLGPWVRPAFEAVGLLDPVEQRIVTGWLLDQFAAALRAYASITPNFRVIDSRGTLTTARQWGNEIHPTASGFRRIVDACWLPALRGILA